MHTRATAVLFLLLAGCADEAANDNETDDFSTSSLAAAGQVGHGDSWRFEISPGGRPREPLDTQDIGAGWTTVKSFKTTWQRPFIFKLSATTGKVAVHSVDSEGSIDDVVFERTWSKGWTS